VYNSDSPCRHNRSRTHLAAPTAFQALFRLRRNSDGAHLFCPGSRPGARTDPLDANRARAVLQLPARANE
ncbi:unnamed protein product, partial [Amoebophrya sp. A120]